MCSLTTYLVRLLWKDEPNRKRQCVRTRTHVMNIRRLPNRLKLLLVLSVRYLYAKSAYNHRS